MGPRDFAHTMWTQSGYKISQAPFCDNATMAGEFLRGVLHLGSEFLMHKILTATQLYGKGRISLMMDAERGSIFLK